MNKEEKLQALKVLDDFLSEEDENFYEKDYKLLSNYSNTSGFAFSRRFKSI